MESINEINAPYQTECVLQAVHTWSAETCLIEKEQ